MQATASSSSSISNNNYLHDKHYSRLKRISYFVKDTKANSNLCYSTNHQTICCSQHFCLSHERDNCTYKLLQTGTICDNEVDSLLKESIRMKQLSHPNVMNLVGVCLDAGSAPYLILPYMANGDLLSLLKKNRSSLLLTTDNGEDEVK